MSVTDLDDQPLSEDEAQAAASGSEPTGVRAVDVEAPLGRTATGVPRVRRPAGTGPRAGRARAKASTTRAPRRRTTPKAAAKAPAAGAPEILDVREGARGLLGGICGVLMMLPRFTGSQAWSLDAMAIELHREPLTEGLAEVADAVPMVKVVLEYFAKASPFARLAAAMEGVAMQLAANHGAIPAGAFGTATPTTLMHQFAEHTGLDLFVAPPDDTQE